MTENELEVAVLLLIASCCILSQCPAVSVFVPFSLPPSLCRCCLSPCLSPSPSIIVSFSQSLSLLQSMFLRFHNYYSVSVCHVLCVCAVSPSLSCNLSVSVSVSLSLSLLLSVSMSISLSVPAFVLFSVSVSVSRSIFHPQQIRAETAWKAARRR